MSKTTSYPPLNPAKLARIKESRKTFKTQQIEWTEHNQGTHFILYILDSPAENIDFWPTTGRFYSRSCNYKGRGLNNLIEFINENYPLEADDE